MYFNLPGGVEEGEDEEDADEPARRHGVEEHPQDRACRAPPKGVGKTPNF